MSTQLRETPQKMSDLKPRMRTASVELPTVSDRSPLAKLPTPPAPSPRKWYRERSFLRKASFVATIGTPLVLLGILVLIVKLPLLLGFLASALVYAGLFMLLSWRPHTQVERETTHDEIRRSLGNATQHVTQLRALAPAMEPLLSRYGGDQRLDAICRLADSAISELGAKKDTTLSAASRLEFVLSETLGILSRFRQVAVDEAALPGSLTPMVEKIEHDILPLIEASLKELAVSLNAEDSLNLDVAIRVLESTLKSEGLSRTS